MRKPRRGQNRDAGAAPARVRVRDGERDEGGSRRASEAAMRGGQLGGAQGEVRDDPAVDLVDEVHDVVVCEVVEDLRTDLVLGLLRKLREAR